MTKKLQVFVSSTYTDLINERQIATQSILDAGHIPAGMELFKAGKSQMETIKRWIDDSDIYMLILGGRYGTIEDESELGYTELEYQYAVSKNIPVFSIILSDRFLASKAADLGQEAVFEKRYSTKYKKFKSKVMTKIVKIVNNLPEIEAIIHATLYDIQQDNSYNLVGWIKADNAASDFHGLSTETLLETQRNTMLAIALKNYPDAMRNTLCEFSDEFVKQLGSILKSSYILNSVQRDITLNLSNSNTEELIVTVAKYFDYAYIAPENSFYIGFWATEKQAETYQNISLKIDGKDYTKALHLTITREESRGQFPFRVSSNSIPLTNPQSSIVHVASYRCPVSEFFQSSRLSYLCKNFEVKIFMLNESLRNHYTLKCSTFSPFSRLHDDDFKTGELLKAFDERIRLPTWSLPGSGYAVTLQKLPELGSSL